MVGSFQLMKSLNRSLILNIIRSAGMISRADIAKKTKLTPPTVTNITGGLLSEGIILEGQTGPSSGGRKPIMLRINSRNFFIAGVDVGVKKIRFGLADLNADLSYQTVVPISERMSEADLVRVITEQVQKLMRESAVPKEKMIGIGIGMHGVVDAERGISVFAPGLKLKNIPLKTMLEDVFLIPVKVENDVRAMALGEAWFGEGRGLDDLICINVGYGIGAGIIMNGRLFRGSHGLAGEIGHTVADLNGPRCTCGNYGCLQTLAAHDGLKNAALKEIILGRPTLISEMADGKPDKISGIVIHEAAKLGDELAIEILRGAGRYLGAAVSNLVHILNPPKIIVGGGISKAGAFILDPLREVVMKRSISEEARKTVIVESGLGDSAGLIGACTLVLSDLFSLNYENTKQTV
ncbi:ROK family protein [Bacillus mangrovi]|uniref:ROK family protein n=2 Tax=Metabacillus mangrovi TaxID=1491830 RepID=A0A7X2S7A7_9BACI|nr:ROK family transcriptional regulator [Metabacillus mangrovi]MTH54610.1 ROK family protein [Metabacillus mangrovi]